MFHLVGIPQEALERRERIPDFVTHWKIDGSCTLVRSGTGGHLRLEAVVIAIHPPINDARSLFSVEALRDGVPRAMDANECRLVTIV